MRFKAGDKVRVKKDLDEIKNFQYGYVSEMKKFEGKIVTIRKDLGDGYSIEECWMNFDERAFEPIYSKPTKQELLNMPVGTKIYTDAKKDNEYVKKGDYNFESRKYTILHEEIEDNLTLNAGNEKNYGSKIIKIEKPTYETVYDCSTKVQEMTVAEIEKALGHAVKIIKEDN